MLQMGLMYFLSAIFKLNGQWFSGQALAGVLTHDFYASEYASYLLRFPKLLPVMTWATLALELAAAFLLFWPRRTASVRLAAIAALATMHLAIGFFLEVGLFSWVALAGLALFLPATFWRGRIFARFRPCAEPVPSAGTARDLAAGKPSMFSRVAQGACMVFLIYVLAVNINSLPGRPLASLSPESWKPFATGLGLRQRWGMFEAVPSRDGWYVARAKLKDGSGVDLLRNGTGVDWSRPNFPAGMYRNHYWQKLFREMAYTDEKGFQLLRPMVSRFLCRDWNARNPQDKQVQEFELVYCMTAPDTNKQGDGIHRERLFYLRL